MLPVQVELLRLSEARVHRHCHFGPFLFADGLPQPRLLMVGEEPHPLVVFPEELYQPHRIGLCEPVSNRDVEHAFEEG